MAAFICSHEAAEAVSDHNQRLGIDSVLRYIRWIAQKADRLRRVLDGCGL